MKIEINMKGTINRAIIPLVYPLRLTNASCTMSSLLVRGSICLPPISGKPVYRTGDLLTFSFYVFFHVSYLPIVVLNPEHLEIAKSITSWLLTLPGLSALHYNDAYAMASQITSVSIVWSTVGSGAEQRKHQSFTSVAFEGELNGDRWMSRTKGQ